MSLSISILSAVGGRIVAIGGLAISPADLTVGTGSRTGDLPNLPPKWQESPSRQRRSRIKRGTRPRRTPQPTRRRTEFLRESRVHPLLSYRRNPPLRRRAGRSFGAKVGPPILRRVGNLHDDRRDIVRAAQKIRQINERLRRFLRRQRREDRCRRVVRLRAPSTSLHNRYRSPGGLAAGPPGLPSPTGVAQANG